MSKISNTETYNLQQLGIKIIPLLNFFEDLALDHLISFRSEENQKYFLLSFESL